jgi:hypothetical protein
LSRIRSNLVALFFMLAPWLAPETAADRERPFVDEAEAPVSYEEPEPWKEADIQIPPAPRDQDLIEFQVDDPERRFTYFIDKRSLRVDPDGVVRYTLVIESRRGVRNYAFEGLRCHTREYKVYAYGSSKGKLRPRKAPKWKAIYEERFSRVHRALHRYYLCERTLNKPLDRDRIILALKGVVDIREPDFFSPW